MKGMDRLRKARELLVHAAGPLGRRQQVEAAAQEFWSAKFHDQTWPQELCDGAERVQRKLFREGIISETVCQMSESELDQLADELLQFIDAAEQCGGANNNAA